MEGSSEQSRFPVFSQEMTLQAHFTFTSPSSPHFKRSEEAQTSTTQSLNVGPKISSGKNETFQWSSERAKCSVACDQQGVTMKYDTAAPLYSISKQKQIYEKTVAASSQEPDKPSSQSPHAFATAMSEPDHKGTKFHTARPYERRCKSTAQIVLQPQTKATQTHPRAREFHGVTPHEVAASKKKEVDKPAEETQSLNDSSKPCYGCKQPPVSFPHCLCSHCSALHNLVKTLRFDLPCSCSCQPQPVQHFHSPRGVTSSSSPSSTFNSHRCYKNTSTTKNSVRENSPPTRSRGQREGTPIPSSRTPSPEDRTRGRHRRNRSHRGETSPVIHNRQEKGVLKRIHSKCKGRPRTIHIDVYCTSSSSDQDSSDDSSPTTEDGSFVGRNRSRTLLALGSKKNHDKNDFRLEQKSSVNSRLTERRASSFVYQRGDDTQSVSAFITEHPLSLCSSPPHPERPVSSPPQIGFKRYKKETKTESINTKSPSRSYDMVFPLPPPVKPDSLPIASIDSQDFHSSISDIISYSDKYQHSQEREMGTSLSWRGSEFETSTPHLSNEWEHSTRSESNLSSLQAAFADLNTEGEESATKDIFFAMPWRSPKLERRKYLTKGQEERHQELLNKRAAANSQLSDTDTLKTPTEVSELAKLSVFKNFSQEELKVISKSLTKRESERSSRGSSTRIVRQSSFRSPQTPPSLSRHSSLLAATEKNTYPNLDSSSCKSTITKLKKDVHTHFADEPCHAVRKKERNQFGHGEFENSLIKKKICKNKDLKSSSGFRIPSAQPVPAVRQTIGTRTINVGVFRRLNRFPFNATHTYPGSLHYQGIRNTEPAYSDHQFVRPHLFGEVIKANKRHGIHYGPPRNPQCSCLSCRIWQIGHTSADAMSGPRLRSHSLSDLSPVPSPLSSSCHSNSSQHSQKHY